MRISFDANKSDRNARLRDLPFERASDFDFETALFKVDDRHDYDEVRFVASGLIDGRLHVMCFTETHDGIRVISLRKANAREVRRYAQATAATDDT